MSSQTIGNIKKRFHNRKEWLLIQVTKLDTATTTPLEGRLLAHSRDRDAIFKKSASCKGTTYIDYSSDRLPKGYAVAF